MGSDAKNMDPIWLDMKVCVCVQMSDTGSDAETMDPVWLDLPGVCVCVCVCVCRCQTLAVMQRTWTQCQTILWGSPPRNRNQPPSVADWANCRGQSRPLLLGFPGKAHIHRGPPRLRMTYQLYCRHNMLFEKVHNAAGSDRKKATNAWMRLENSVKWCWTD